MLLLWISLILFLLYFLGQTVWGLAAYQKIVDALKDGRLKRTELYVRLIAGQWLPAAAVLLLTAFSRITLSDIGLGWRRYTGGPWLVIVSLVMAGLYFVYLVLSLIGLKRNAAKKVNSSQKIPDRIRAMYPVSRQEKRVWGAMAVTAGVCEELLFRGFLLYLIGALFPVLPVAAVLVIASVVFGAGHLYQGIGEAIKPALFGLAFGVIYISFGTLLPCMLLHAMQDWCAMYVINEEDGSNPARRESHTAKQS